MSTGGRWFCGGGEGEWNKKCTERGSSSFVPSHSCGKRSPDMISHPFNFRESSEKSRSSLGGFLVLARQRVVVSLSQEQGHTSACNFVFYPSAEPPGAKSDAVCMWIYLSRSLSLP